MGLEVDAINAGQGSWFRYIQSIRPLTPDEVALACEMGIDPDTLATQDETPRGIETIKGGIDTWDGGVGAAALDGAGVTE